MPRVDIWDVAKLFWGARPRVDIWDVAKAKAASPADACKSIPKTVELRVGRPPRAALGARVWLLATQGADGVAALDDAFDAGTAAAVVPGWVVFSENVTVYRSRAAFDADADAHRVPPGSPYGWHDGVTTVLYG